MERLQKRWKEVDLAAAAGSDRAGRWMIWWGGGWGDFLIGTWVSPSPVCNMLLVISFWSLSAAVHLALTSWHTQQATCQHREKRTWQRRSGGGRKDDVSGGGGGGRLEVESRVPSVRLAVWRRVGAPALKWGTENMQGGQNASCPTNNPTNMADWEKPSGKTCLNDKTVIILTQINQIN